MYDATIRQGQDGECKARAGCRIPRSTRCSSSEWEKRSPSPISSRSTADGDDGDNYNVVNVKPTNRKLTGPKKEYFVCPVTGDFMVPKTTSEPVTDTSIVREGIADLHSAVLSAYHNQRKGGVVISYGDNYMISIEFDGPYGNGGVYGVMVFVDKCPTAQAVVRDRGCQRATELGRNFLAGETVQYTDTTNEADFFSLLSRYKMQARTQGHIDLKSGMRLYDVTIAV